MTPALRRHFGTMAMAATVGFIRMLAPPLIVWQSVVWLVAPPRYFLPSPFDVLAVFRSQGAFSLCMEP